MPKSVRKSPKKLALDREDLMTAYKHRRIVVIKMKSVPLIRRRWTLAILQRRKHKPESIYTLKPVFPERASAGCLPAREPSFSEQSGSGLVS